ncbi:PREDICTED: C-factor-like [Gekko japonicus]|uniref:C-factor-like n=1 Tax=Gekko japonicus TaxID=146911 RepID=A0ABM1JQJ6_GEKJA|nr:PREDICTED: C-factor-like [Gekko japonicus]
MTGGHIGTVMVTGANRGIGLELIRQLAEMPNPPERIFATCRDPQDKRMQEMKKLAAKHPSIVILKLEATDEESIKAAAKEVEAHLAGKGLNLLINNAGVMPPSTLESVTQEDMLNVCKINLVGPMLVTKTALNMLTRCQALEYKDDGILFAAIHPGWVKTDMGTEKAELMVEESVHGILNVLSNLSEEHSGRFLNWEGKFVAW